jgi:hypothetical protein
MASTRRDDDQCVVNCSPALQEIDKMTIPRPTWFVELGMARDMKGDIVGAMKCYGQALTAYRSLMEWERQSLVRNEMATRLES